MASTTELTASNSDEWQDIVTNCFVPLSCRSSDAEFSGTMRHFPSSSATSISDVRTDGTSVERTEYLAARSVSDDLHLSFQIRASGTINQCGRSVNVSPGRVTIYATHLPYRQDYTLPGQRQLILQLPRRALDLPSRMLDDACARLSVPLSAAARRLGTYAAAGLNEESPHESPWTWEVLTDLASTVFRQSFATGPVTPYTSAGMHFAMMEYIDEHFASPDLTVDSLAVAHCISRRRLYQVFDDAGAHPAAAVRNRRLDHAAALLEQRASPENVGVAAVAAASGFADTTTFTRAFRRRFEVSPREHRSRRH